MENEKQPAELTQTTRSVGVKFGLIMGAVSIAYFMTLIVLDVDTTEGVGRWASLFINAGLIFFAHKTFKDNSEGGFMSYGQGFTIGFWMSLVSSVISSVFTYIYVKFIDQGFIQMMLDKQEEGMLERGMSDAQVEQAMEMSAKFMTPNSMLIFGVIFGTIILLIVAAVISIFTQKKNPDPFA